MSTPIRFGVAAPVQAFQNASRAAAPSGFAARMGGGLGAALASGVQTMGRQVLHAALGGLPPVVQNLASNAAAAVTGGAVGGPDAAMLDAIDKCHTYLMMNAIFDASNAPIVERVA